MVVILSIINEGEIFIIKELDPRIIGYLERNVDGLMIKTENLQGVSGIKYLTFPKGYKLDVEKNSIEIDFPSAKTPKGPIKIFY